MKANQFQKSNTSEVNPNLIINFREEKPKKNYPSKLQLKSDTISKPPRPQKTSASRSTKNVLESGVKLSKPKNGNPKPGTKLPPILSK